MPRQFLSLFIVLQSSRACRTTSQMPNPIHVAAFLQRPTRIPHRPGELDAPHNALVRLASRASGDEPAQLPMISELRAPDPHPFWREVVLGRFDAVLVSPRHG